MEKSPTLSDNPEALAPQDDFATVIENINHTDCNVITSLNSTNPDARQEFLDNPRLTVPPNTHDRLDADQVSHNLAEISRLEQVIEDSEHMSDKQKRVANMALSFNARKNNFLMACANYNENPTFENSRAHRAANEALYGKPDKDTFLSFLNEKLDKIKSKDLSPEEKQEFIELQSMLGYVPPAEHPRYRPQPETIQRFGEMTKTFLAPYFEHIPEGKDSFTIQEAADIANEVIKDFLPDDTQWMANVVPESQSADADQHNFTFHFPGSRPAGPTYSVPELKNTMGHEVGTHGGRAFPYEKHPVQMFRTGFPDYETFEEGVARTIEQGLSGQYVEAGVNHYISIGLATFMGRNFRQTFEIQKRLGHLTTGKDQTQLMYKSVQRAFRGTDRLPNNKDLVYYNGNAEVWRFIEEHLDDPDLFDHLFLSGKTDYTNAEHERVIYESKVGGI